LNLKLSLRPQTIAISWPLLVLGAAGLCAYLLVSIEPRYLAPFILLVLISFFPGMHSHTSSLMTRRNTNATLAVAAAVILLTAFFVVHRATLPVLKDFGGVHDQAAEALGRAGIRPGDDVGIIGSGSDQMIFARLARVKIIAQMLPEDSNDFWLAPDPKQKEQVYKAFSRDGAKAVVTDEQLPSAGFADWQRLGDTPYYVHVLTTSGS
jgi:hypothetical protein